MARIEQKPGKVTFTQAVNDFFRGYVDFKGRTTRAGYWWALLMYALVYAAFLIIFTLFLFSSAGKAVVAENFEQFFLNTMLNSGLLGLFFMLFTLGTFLPLFAMKVRRYRDAGITGSGIVVFLIAGYLIRNVVAGNSLVYLMTYGLMILELVLTLLPTDTFFSKSTDNDVKKFFFRVKS